MAIRAKRAVLVGYDQCINDQSVYHHPLRHSPLIDSEHGNLDGEAKILLDAQKVRRPRCIDGPVKMGNKGNLTMNVEVSLMNEPLF